MEDNKQKNIRELKRNTIIIAFSNLGSKAISFVLAPLYSYYMTVEEYGKMDLVTTTIALLIPLLCLDIYEATFRFTSDHEYDQKTVFSSSLTLGVTTSTFALIIITLLWITSSISDVLLYALIASSIDVVFNILIQYARGKQKMMTFALSGVINSVVILLSSIIFLVFLRLGLKGWIISYLIAKSVATVVVFIAIKGWNQFSIRLIQKTFFRDAFKYCLPLLPTTSMWWIMNASDRYMIAFFVGTAANGIYAVANKLPSILSVFENVFYQAWQTTAINTSNDKDRNEFYSSIFNKYIIILSTGVLGILIILKQITVHLFEASYAQAWECTSILVIAVMMHAIGGMLGIYYTVFKNTKGALFTSFVGAIVNIILNYFFIPIYGINAAAATTLIGYITVIVIRWFDVKKYVKIQINERQTIPLVILLLFQLILYYIDSVWAIILQICIFAFVVFKNRKLLLGVISRQNNK